MARLTSTLTTLALAALLAGCAAGSTAVPTQASAPDTSTVPASGEADSAAAVSVRNIAFQPPALQVSPGTEVTWTNHDRGVAHTATSGEVGEGAVPGVAAAKPSKPDGTFDGALDDAGAEFSFTFSEPGTYAYFCEIHPSMTGEVDVR